MFRFIQTFNCKSLCFLCVIQRWGWGFTQIGPTQTWHRRQRPVPGGRLPGSNGAGTGPFKCPGHAPCEFAERDTETPRTSGRARTSTRGGAAQSAQPGVRRSERPAGSARQGARKSARAAGRPGMVREVRASREASGRRGRSAPGPQSGWAPAAPGEGAPAR